MGRVGKGMGKARGQSRNGKGSEARGKWEEVGRRMNNGVMEKDRKRKEGEKKDRGEKSRKGRGKWQGE